MGIQHFSGLFVLLCMGVGGALLTLAGEHTFYHLVIPRLRRTHTLQYWLHTSQVSECVQCVCVCVFVVIKEHNTRNHNCHFINVFLLVFGQQWSCVEKEDTSGT